MAMRQQFRTAVVLALASCALHPLLGIWPLLLIVAQRVSDRTVLIAGITALTLIAGLHFSGFAAPQRLERQGSVQRWRDYRCCCGQPISALKMLAAGISWA
jgi:hypothetical protein